MGFLSRLRSIKIQVGGSALHADPDAAAERARRELESRPLLGPAGEHVYGPDPGRGEQPSGARPVVVSADPREQVSHERTMREEARRPYLAPSPRPVCFTRLGTRAGEAADGLAAHLASSGLAGRPDLVYGIYRVPDHIGRPSTRAARRYEEWDVVHAATESLPVAPVPSAVFLDARQRWVARTSGDPSVLDEDLAIALLQGCGIPPERCLGTARILASRAGSREPSGIYAKMAVTGVAVIVPGDVAIGATVDQLASAAPIVLPPGPPPGTHVEVANWVAVAKAVHPRTGAPQLVPSPFPYLPSTPQELLQSYLQIVGVVPADCYSAQVTIDVTKDIVDREDLRWGTATTGQGQSQPCVDGKARPRLSGAARVVVAYRDRPEYELGRARWADYQRDVLQARLENRAGTRRPVPEADRSTGGPARVALRAAGVAAELAGAVIGGVAGAGADLVAGSGSSGRDPFDDIPDARYCWPPTDAG